MPNRRLPRYFLSPFLLLALFLALPVRADAPGDLLERLDGYPHTRRLEHEVRSVIDYEVGLGAIQKRSGAWQFKRSERLSGTLERYTWQVVDGFTAAQVLARLEQELVASSEMLFACDSRACGQGSQWANGVFGQRLLYGRDENQHYRVYGPPAGAAADYRVLLFSAARMADRQYLHAEILRVE
ncbi:DUF4892 domain-containing protein [Mangrovimicrobium sediminis]|uniref:DUF4892 domain-containing protein n=1 Tax=Mangrovimicrobium sediminis TaxID=2562682 RepID=A0A4Z0M742_9GAMM|nr:DUF4892 domain-containing protein [Haliea sp. SAOS-164]TGD75228.1 DUF4892 domain-containing protein [Haliea sp. SAOS-164]